MRRGQWADLEDNAGRLFRELEDCPFDGTKNIARRIHCALVEAITLLRDVTGENDHSPEFQAAAVARFPDIED